MISPRIDWFYSDRYVREKYKTFCGNGKKGTVVLFDSNMLHRAYPGTGGRRENLHINFTPKSPMYTRLPLVEFFNTKLTSPHASCFLQWERFIDICQIYIIQSPCFVDINLILTKMIIL